LIWLADENVPLLAVDQLLRAGVDIDSMSRRHPGASDEEVLRLAKAERRGLLTFDRDFGELIFARDLRPPPSVVYVRFVAASAAEVANTFLSLIENDDYLETYFIVLDRDTYRRRRLPDR